ncbi:hypothetical protein M0R45_005044 [Rubus argutus]|uniref:Uncharacterized protein n=1 Tax=Rubus argutus TaxID=59490 RepID=A0AAW1YLL1_RUBAR
MYGHSRHNSSGIPQSAATAINCSMKLSPCASCPLHSQPPSISPARPGSRNQKNEEDERKVFTRSENENRTKKKGRPACCPVQSATVASSVHNPSSPKRLEPRFQTCPLPSHVNP